MADEMAGELLIHPVCSPTLSTMENMDESLKLYRLVPIASVNRFRGRQWQDTSRAWCRQRHDRRRHHHLHADL